MDRVRVARLLSSLHTADVSRSVMRRICVVSAAATSTDGSAISRLDANTHSVVGASCAWASRLGRMQTLFEEGPSLQAATWSLPCLAPHFGDARTRERWPRFTPTAVDEGVRAVFSFPLFAAGVATGTLDVYTRHARELRSDELNDALVLAELASIAVADLTASDRVDLVSEAVDPVEAAHPSVVHHATGMISEQLDVDVEEALLRLQAYGFATDHLLVDVACAVVDGRLRLEPWRLGD